MQSVNEPVTCFISAEKLKHLSMDPFQKEIGVTRALGSGKIARLDALYLGEGWCTSPGRIRFSPGSPWHQEA